jgi:hypothetical protein
MIAMPLQRLPARGLLLLFLTFVLLPVAPTAAQDSSWEGNAAVVRKGEFASPGLFAASDSFPQGTLLQVENPQNGRAVQVTVVERINGRGTVFLLLSDQAAAVLGLPSSEVIRVRARVLIASIDTARPGSRERTASADQDLNPAAAIPPEALKPAPAAVAPAAAPPAAAEPAAPPPAPAAAVAVEPGTPAVTPLAAPTAPAAAALPGEPPPTEVPAAPVPQPPEQPAVSEPAPAAPAAPLATLPTEEPAPPAPEAAPETPAVQAMPAAPPAGGPGPEPAISAEPPAAPGPEPAIAPREPAPAAPTAAPAAALRPEERRLEELAARIPQKRLFQPPQAPAEAPVAAAEREPAIAAPAPAAPAEPAVAAPEPEEAPESGSLSALPPVAPGEAAPALVPAEETPPAELPLAGLEPATAETVPEEPPAEVGAEPALAAPEAAPELEGVVEASPEAPAPEVAVEPPPAAAAPPEEPLRIGGEAPAPAIAMVPSTLVRKSFYLQLAAYSTRSLAEKLASQVSTYARYSVEILPSTAGAAPLYKVLIGPLNRDESGTLLYQFRARGFRDAFIQYVE